MQYGKQPTFTTNFKLSGNVQYDDETSGRRSKFYMIYRSSDLLLAHFRNIIIKRFERYNYYVDIFRHAIKACQVIFSFSR